MRKLLSILLLAAALPAAAQDPDVLRAAMYLGGASSEEELDQSLVELLEQRKGRPVRINSGSLRESALLSGYQVAVIKDYRSTSGDILSWDELALLDGFTKAGVEALKPFLSLSSPRLPGASDTLRTRVQALARATLANAGGKVKVTGRSWRAGGAARCTYRGRKWDGTVFGEAEIGNHTVWAGDYRLRFGEGLAFWTGFSMESLSTVDAFVKRAQGISPVWSFTSSGILRGLAYEYGGASWRASAFGSLDKSFGGRGEYLGKRFQAGFTAGYQPGTKLILSADAKLNLRGAIISGEVASRSGSVAAIMAFKAPLGEHFRVAAQGRIIPRKYSGKKNGEYAGALGFDFRGRSVLASLTADASMLPIPSENPRRFQLRVYGKALWNISSRWTLEGRLTERYRNYERPRTALRAHIGFTEGPWNANLRGETLWCEGWGILSYGEAGYKGESFTAWLRITGFYAPGWNDRIYVYERDAPGSFSVPAYYGKGVSAALTANWKHRFRYLTLKAYIRAACTFKNGSKPAPVLNLQTAVDF